MTLDPKNFVFDAPTGIELSRQNRESMRENSHLALKFPINELRGYFHPTMPGKVTVVQAQSHNFKTEFLNYWTDEAAKELAEETRRGVIVKINVEDAVEGLIEADIARQGGGSLDDISMGIIKDENEFIRAETLVGQLPIVHIGESLGMDDSNAAMLYLTNIFRLIDHVRKNHFAEYTPIAGIFIDYIQALPLDPEHRTNRNMQETRRSQVMKDMDRIKQAAKYFSCPIVLAAQSKQNEDLSSRGKVIKLPDYWDVQETSYVPQRADFMYSLWMPKMHYSPGTVLDSENKKWNFIVENDMLWIKSLKHKKYRNVGASFPLKVSQYGEVSLNKNLYDHIVTMERA
jgi:hypothetical protein